MRSDCSDISDRSSGKSLVARASGGGGARAGLGRSYLGPGGDVHLGMSTGMCLGLAKDAGLGLGTGTCVGLGVGRRLLAGLTRLFIGPTRMRTTQVAITLRTHITGLLTHLARLCWHLARLGVHVPHLRVCSPRGTVHLTTHLGRTVALLAITHATFRCLTRCTVRHAHVHGATTLTGAAALTGSAMLTRSTTLARCLEGRLRRVLHSLRSSDRASATRECGHRDARGDQARSDRSEPSDRLTLRSFSSYRLGLRSVYRLGCRF